MPGWMECSWRRIPCGQDDCKICGRIKNDRKRHIAAGRDPDDLKNVFNDVGRIMGETMVMVRQRAEEMGIDLDNLEDVSEPPKPNKFPLHKKVMKWRKLIHDIGESASASNSVWLNAEAAKDLFWYANTITAKIYRQHCNRWEIDQKDDYAEFDYEYTKRVLIECMDVLKKSLQVLHYLNTPQDDKIVLALTQLTELEDGIVKI